MFGLFNKPVEVMKNKPDDVQFTESHAVEIGGTYVGSIAVRNNGRFGFEVSPYTTGCVRLTECRLEKILTKLKELNANVPVSR